MLTLSSFLIEVAASRAARASACSASWAAPRSRMLKHPVIPSIFAGLFWGELTRLPARPRHAGGDRPHPAGAGRRGAALRPDHGRRLARPCRPQGALAAAAVATVFKLAVLPLMVWLSGRYLFTLDPLWLTVATLNAAMPAGANVYLVAQLYRTGVGLATNAVVISTGGQRAHFVGDPAAVRRAGALGWLAEEHHGLRNGRGSQAHRRLRRRGAGRRREGDEQPAVGRGAARLRRARCRLLPRPEAHARAAHRVRAALGADRRQPLLQGGRRAIPRSPRCARSPSRRPTSAAAGTPTTATMPSRRWARSCWRASCRRRAATRCSPTCTAPSRRSRPACSARSRACAPSTARRISSAPEGVNDGQSRRRPAATATSTWWATTSSIRW